MSQPIPLNYITLLLASLFSTRLAIDPTGISYGNIEARAILATGLVMCVITPEQSKRLERLAANACQHRIRELNCRLRPYGNWGRQHVGVAA